MEPDLCTFPQCFVLCSYNIVFNNSVVYDKGLIVFAGLVAAARREIRGCTAAISHCILITFCQGRQFLQPCRAAPLQGEVLQCFRVVALQTVLQPAAVPGDTQLTDGTDLLSFPVRRPAAGVTTHSSVLSPAGLVTAAEHCTGRRACCAGTGLTRAAPPPPQADQGAVAHTSIGTVVN